MVCLPNRDIEFFDIVTGVLQGDTLAAYMFIICQDNVLWTSIDLLIENDFALKDKRQMISHRNYDRHRLHRSSSTFCEDICPRPMSVA